MQLVLIHTEQGKIEQVVSTADMEAYVAFLDINNIPHVVYDNTAQERFEVINNKMYVDIADNNIVKNKSDLEIPENKVVQTGSDFIIPNVPSGTLVYMESAEYIINDGEIRISTDEEKEIDIFILSVPQFNDAHLTATFKDVLP